MSARIDTTRTLSDDSIEYIINNFESVNLEDAFISGNFEDANDLFQAIEIIETATLIKPEANPLEAHVIEWINEQAEGYTSDTPHKEAVKDLMHGGCKSGIVGHLIYYTQTNSFVDEYEDEISAIIDDLKDNCGEVDFLFKDGANLKNIKNIMAWCAFEETARNLMIECGYEDEF